MANLRTYVDILFLHSPFQTGVANLRAWKAFESYVPHQIRHLGVSNASTQFIRGLYERVSIKPYIVHNRFWARTNFDAELRDFTAQKGMIYQAYGMLRSGDDLLRSQVLLDLAERIESEPGLALYVLILGLGHVSILNGTCRQRRMKQDLQVIDRATADLKLQEELKGYYVRFKEPLMSSSSRKDFDRDA